MKPSSQLCVANVPELKSGVKSGKYVIAPFRRDGRGGHCAVKENNFICNIHTLHVCTKNDRLAHRKLLQ